MGVRGFALDVWSPFPLIHTAKCLLACRTICPHGSELRDRAADAGICEHREQGSGAVAREDRVDIDGPWRMQGCAEAACVSKICPLNK